MGSIQRLVPNLWKVHESGATEEVENAPESEKVLARLPNPGATTPGKEDVSNEQTKQLGVSIAEATYATMGSTFYVLMVFILVASFVNLLNNQIINLYTTNVAGPHLNASVKVLSTQTLQQVIQAVTTPLTGKVADIFGRPTVCILVLLFYTVGLVILASAQSLNDYFGGVVLWGIGNSSITVLLYILVADYIPARSRALGISLISLPSFITFAVGPLVYGTLSESPHWRWLMGMFALIIPAVMAPMSAVLIYNQHRAKKLGLLPRNPYMNKNFLFSVKEFLLDSDIGGVLMLGAGFILLLLPLSLTSKYSAPWVIALLVVGSVLVLATPLYERYLSPRPFIRRQWLNPDVVLVMILAFFDYLAYNTSFQALYYWSSLTMRLQKSGQSYFISTQTVTLTLFGIISGVIVAATKRYKWLIVAGACIRLLGVGVMYCYRHRGTTIVQAVWPQVVQAIGGGIMGVLLQAASQVTVRHQDVAMVTAAVLLVFELGGSVGYAVFTSLYQSQYPAKAAQRLPQLPPSQRTAEAVLLCAPSVPNPPPQKTCNGLIDAYNDVVRLSLIAALVFSAVPVICALFLRDWKLTNTQNVVSGELPAKHFFSFKAQVPYNHGTLKDEGKENAIERPEQSVDSGLP